MLQNVYYSPEKFGLKMIGSVELSDGCYQFNIFAVWQDKRGQLYYDQDSGCSCPSPFEGIHKVDQLTKATSWEIARALAAAVVEDADTRNPWGSDIQADAAELSNKVLNLKGVS